MSYTWEDMLSPTQKAILEAEMELSTLRCMTCNRLGHLCDCEEREKELQKSVRITKYLVFGVVVLMVGMFLVGMWLRGH